MGVNTTLVLENFESEAFRKLSIGEYDAFLELWGNADLKEQYTVQDQTVEDAGNLGVVGRIGW